MKRRLPAVLIVPAVAVPGGGAEPARRWLSLPLWCLKGACLLCLLPLLPLAFFLPPSPRPPSPPGKGEIFSLFRRGLRPRHPGIKPLAALTEPAERVPGVGLYPLRGGAGVAFRYPAGEWQLRRGSGEQCRQPRRGGTGGDGTIRRKRRRRLRWSSPPGQG